MIVIDAPHFYAAVVLDKTGRVARAAPIIAYMCGWPSANVLAYCRRKRWKTTQR